MTSFALVIPAAGFGRRMGTETPKPFLPLGERTVLEHTVEAFLSVAGLQQIVIVAQEEWVSTVRSWREWVPESIEWTVVVGGHDRVQSVRNGLNQIQAGIHLVAVHDAVRPFVSPGRISACLQRASETGAAILAIPVRDTIKIVDPDRSVVIETPDRARLWQAQTPQIFERALLEEAYRNHELSSERKTDDASLVEALGRDVSIVEGEVQNFKLTWPVERLMAERLLEERSQ